MEVSAPVAKWNYNNFMNEVNQHDRLCSSAFSIGKKHKLKKYYVEFFIFPFFDAAVTNAWIYYKISNPGIDEKASNPADFYLSLVEKLVR